MTRATTLKGRGWLFPGRNKSPAIHGLFHSALLEFVLAHGSDGTPLNGADTPLACPLFPY